jgi:hypothetical protein
MPQATIPVLTRRNGRLTKFTPERIQQIKNLVERGKSRQEIAELLDVTVGSLQVTCSRLGISLRRTFLDPNHRSKGSTALTPSACQHQQDLQLQAKDTTPHREQMESHQPDLANFTLRIQYKGRVRATKLPLTESMIGQLALEAEFRHLGIGELLSELITTTMKMDILQLVLDGQDVASIQTHLAASLLRDLMDELPTHCDVAPAASTPS